MPLGIGNNLIRNGGVLNPDGLSLDLQFAADKTLTARRGPTPTFVRGSGATQVGATGFIEYAPENLIPTSGSATNGNAAYFTRVITGELDPDGDTTAEFTSLATGSQARLESIGILGFSYFSVWVKAKEGSPLPAYMHLVVADGPKVAFNTSSWATVNDSGAIGSVEYGPNGWVKLRSLFPVTTASTLFKIVVTDGPTYGDGIAAGKVFILGGKQVSRNPSSQHYKTTGSPFYGPRFDHDPVTLACKGLLIEEGRTNQWSASEDFGALGWQLINTTTLNSNNTTAPDGLTTADRFTVGSTTQEYGVFRNSFSFVSGTTYTISCYLKADQVTRVSIYALTQATLPIDAYFDLTGNGSVTANASGTASIQKLSNGCYRCVITGTASASAITSVRINAATTGNSRNYVGNSVDSFWAWGAQLEAGSFATSYIPTTTGTLARSADLCSITGGNFSGFYNTPEGTLFAGVTPQSVAQAAVVVGVNTANYINSHFILKTDSLTTSAGLRWVGVSFPPVNIIPSTLNAANAFAKIAYAYKSGSFAMAYNNILAGTSSTTFTSINPTAMWIGARDDGLAINGHISEVKYFKKRLPNAKIQALTV